MTIYCDTSLLVSALTVEPGSALAAAWFERSKDQPLAISDWSVTEFASALGMKHRQGVITTEARAVLEERWRTLAAGLRSFPLTGTHFHRAAVLVDAAPRGLRAGDALHLAVTLDHHCALATLDRDLANAARNLGVTVHQPA